MTILYTIIGTVFFIAIVTILIVKDITKTSDEALKDHYKRNK